MKAADLVPGSVHDDPYDGHAFVQHLLERGQFGDQVFACRFHGRSFQT